VNALQLPFLKILGVLFPSPRFADPGALAQLALVALVAFLLITALARRRHNLLDQMFAQPTRRTAIPGASALRPWLRALMVVLALGCFAVALARPQFGAKSELTKRYGIDLVIAIDASRSMLARDIQPSRIARAKLELSEMLDRRKGDRVGLVVFAGDAFTQCPLTNDLAAAKLFLRAVDVANMPVQGTDIARALEESKDLLVNAERRAKARVILLLTDGEDTMNSGVAAQVAELEAMGIQVLALGLGTTAGEPIPEMDKRGNFVGYKKDRRGNTVMARLDESGLASIADQTGGSLILATPHDPGFQKIEALIDGFAKSEFEGRTTTQYEELFVPFAFAGLLFLLLGAAIRPGRETASPKATSKQKRGAA
jgi:Ca-activated chloride channel family protein